MKKGRKPEYPEKTPGDELQKMPHTSARRFKPQARLEPVQLHWWQARKADMLTVTPRVAPPPSTASTARRACGLRFSTTVLIFKPLQWLGLEKDPRRKRDSNPGLLPLEADYIPLGQRYNLLGTLTSAKKKTKKKQKKNNNNNKTNKQKPQTNKQKTTTKPPLISFFFFVSQLHLWASPFLGEIFTYVTVCFLIQPLR